MLFGITVQAEEITSPEAIIEKCNQVMNQKKVMGIEILVSSEGQQNNMMKVITDSNTAITYYELFGVAIYMDGNKQLLYTYNEEDRCWYVLDGKGNDMTPDMEETGITNDGTYSYTYKGITMYRGVSCKTVTATAQGNLLDSEELTYYINEASYELCGEASYQDGVLTEIVYTYPESVTIPADILQSALIEPETSITKNKIEYTAAKSGKKVVLKVTNGKKVKSANVTIPDTVTFDGKIYKVVAVSDKAFFKNKKIKNVTIGKNVKKIGKQAFYKCSKLSKLTIKSEKLK